MCFAPPVHDNFLRVMRNCDYVTCGECGSGAVSCSLRFLGDCRFLVAVFLFFFVLVLWAIFAAV